MTKLNLLLKNAGGVRSGFINIDAVDADDARQQGNVANLQPFVDAGEVSELLALGVLDYIAAGEADAVLDHWVSRLAHGGRITVSTVDLMEVTRNLQSRMLSEDDAGILLYGEQREPWQFRKGTYSLARLAGVLGNKGLKILHKRIDNYMAVVVAERP